MEIYRQNSSSLNETDNFELITASLLFNDLLSLNEYNIKPWMFFNNGFNKYANFLEENKNKKNTREINQIFTSKNPNIKFMSNLALIEKLEIYDKKTIIQMFYKKAIESYLRVKIGNISTSFDDSTALDQLRQIVGEIDTLIKEICITNNEELPDIFAKYKEFYNNIVERQLEYGTSDVIGISSGIYALDTITKGFKESEYVIVAGRPSMGKTSFALDVVADAVLKGRAVLFFSIEMSTNQIIARLLPKINRALKLTNTLMAHNNQECQDSINEALNLLSQSRLFIEDFSSYRKIGLSEIRSVVDIFEKKYGKLDMGVIDYVQLLQGNSFSYDENSKMTDISADIKRLAKETGAPWLVLSQLNRGLEQRSDKRPTMADIRGSGSLEQDADLILFPYRSSVYIERDLKNKIEHRLSSDGKKSNESIADMQEALNALQQAEIEDAEIIIGKNRNGALGSALVKFHRASASYVPESFQLGKTFLN